MRDDDVTGLARRIVNIFPQARDAALGASVISGFAYSALLMTQPVLEPIVGARIHIYPLSFQMLFWLLLAPVWAAVALAKWVSPRQREQEEFETVVDVLEATMKKGQYTKVERKAVWRSVVTELTKSARLGGATPSGSALGRAAELEIAEVERMRSEAKLT